MDNTLIEIEEESLHPPELVSTTFNEAVPVPAPKETLMEFVPAPEVIDAPLMVHL